MSQIELICTECKLDGDHFKLCIPILLKYFKVSVPFLNGADMEFSYTHKSGNFVTNNFNVGSHWDYLNEESEIRFFVMNSEEIVSLFEKSGLDYDFFVIILLAEHLYIHSIKSNDPFLDPIRTEEQFEELERQGVEFDIKVHPDDMYLYATEKKYTPNADEELNRNQEAFLEEVSDESDYINHIRQEMLELYLFVNDWKTSKNQPLTLKCGAKSLKLNNYNNWIFKALNEYLNKHTDIDSVEEAEDDLAFNYSKKTGRKANNKYQTLMIYGIDNLYRNVTKTEEITNQQCKFIRDYLKHIGLPLTQDYFDHDDDLKNIRSRIRYFRKNGCPEIWGLSSLNYDMTMKFYDLQARGK
ncbi:hypothetical protein E2605_06595 [Dysgonomonas capnocytophagoides]|uniref:Uncharacterized protein n=1 Tax=Dysgonomonas capnocytophagoides TaxID=45254 RepID=A0A4Y8L4Z8_9BACT|nr:hypothetical protein [Dysgonomonas capnocytophagoides]TFD97331.1 hypothetical protein E2605_06595 [Dysgonomonas capnocytophagoides]